MVYFVKSKESHSTGKQEPFWEDGIDALALVAKANAATLREQLLAAAKRP